MANFSLPEVVENMQAAQKMLQETGRFAENIGELGRLIEHAQAPLLVMVMGEFSTGKSTFINALVGQEIAAVNATPTTAVITELAYGEKDQLRVHFKDGHTQVYAVDAFRDLTAETKQSHAELHASIDFVERLLPVEVLKSLTIIDSPGINALKPEHLAVTNRFITRADTVLWMFSAEKALSRTELDAMDKLSPRLQPIAIVNKMDSIDEEEDDPAAFLQEIRRKLKDRVQAVIGISAELAFRGRQAKDEVMAAAGNLAAFDAVLREQVLPQRDSYKANSLLDELSYWIDTLAEAIEEQEEKNKQLEKTDYETYVANRSQILQAEDAVNQIAGPLKEYCRDETANASAVLFLGVLYDNGIGVEKDEARALQAYEKAAIKNSTYAQLAMGGHFVSAEPPDYEKALFWLEKAAKTDARAQAIMGAMYIQGLGVEQDYAQARTWLEMAGDDGLPVGQFLLGKIYQNIEPRDIQKAVACYEKAAARNHDDAQLALSGMYRRGEGVPQDDAKSFALAQQAAEQGNDEAQCRLGWYFTEGIGTARDLTQAKLWAEKAAAQENGDAMGLLGIFALQAGDDAAARSWYQKGAELGDMDCQYQLGRFFQDGRGDVERDMSAAAAWYGKAAEQGQAEAIGRLTGMYYSGQGVEQDYERAFALAQQGAEQDEPFSLYGLAVMYQEGKGTAPDLDKALAIFLRLAEANDEDADLLTRLGDIYYEQGNDTAAVSWMQKAVKLGSSRAMYILAEIYDGGGDGVPKIPAKAKQLYQQAAEAGDPDAQFEVGWRAEKKERYDEACAWYQKAASQGQAMAQLMLGDCYYNGQGTAVDYEAAFYWYTKAAEQGNTSAQVSLGNMYDEGRGTAEDCQQAWNWYKQAAEAGNDWGCYHLGYMCLCGRGVPKNEVQAFQWYKKAAKKKNAFGQAWLGYCYANGIGTQHNLAVARQWYEKAALQGNSMAMNNLGYMYQHGEGVAVDLTQARAWYERAIEQGNETASKNLATLASLEQEKPEESGEARSDESKSSEGQSEMKLDANGRPMVRPGTAPAAAGTSTGGIVLHILRTLFHS